MTLCSLQWVTYQILTYLLHHSVSARLLLCKVTIFPFVIIKHLGEIPLDMQVLCFSSNFHPIFGIYQWILPTSTIITVVFASWWFAISLIPSNFINCNSEEQLNCIKYQCPNKLSKDKSYKNNNNKCTGQQYFTLSYNDLNSLNQMSSSSFLKDLCLSKLLMTSVSSCSVLFYIIVASFFITSNASRCIFKVFEIKSLEKSILK